MRLGHTLLYKIIKTSIYCRFIRVPPFSQFDRNHVMDMYLVTWTISCNRARSFSDVIPVGYYYDPYIKPKNSLCSCLIRSCTQTLYKADNIACHRVCGFPLLYIYGILFKDCKLSTLLNIGSGSSRKNDLNNAAAKYTSSGPNTTVAPKTFNQPHILAHSYVLSATLTTVI